MKCEKIKIMWKAIAEERGGTPLGEIQVPVVCCKEGEHTVHQFELAQEATQKGTLVYLERDKR